jgi:hypothetical protein
MRMRIQHVVTVECEVNDETVEAFVAALGDRMKVTLSTNARDVAEAYIRMNLIEVLHADERDLLNIAEIEKPYLLGVNVKEI